MTDDVANALTGVIPSGQFYQFETRALAIAATIPAGVPSIRITRFAAGHPISYATYVPAKPGGAMAFRDAGGHAWELDLSGGVINPNWYGAIGDNVTDNQAALTAVIARAGNGAYAIKFNPNTGPYCFSGNLNFGASNLRTTFEGSATLKHTGSGVAISLDGGATTNSWNGMFGWDNPPFITGNPNTTRLLYVRGWHHGKCAARLGDANGTSGRGFHNEFSVCSEFDIECSVNSTPFASRPAVPVYIDKRNAGEWSTDSKYNLVVEGMPTGVNAAGVQCSRFTGTSEGNASGGVSIGPSSQYNDFDRFFCEANASGVDFDVQGGNNKFKNCIGSSATTMDIHGSRNIIEGGVYAGAVIVRNGTASNSFHLAQIGSWSDSGVDTRLIDCFNNGGVLYPNETWA